MFQSENLETLKLRHLETLILVGLGRLELPTSPLSGVRSSHLSYRPGFFTDASRSSVKSFEPRAASFKQTQVTVCS